MLQHVLSLARGGMIVRLLGILSLRLSLFAWNFANFLAIHIHIYLPIFDRFISLFHQMALIFPRVPIVFTLSSFKLAYSPIKCKGSVSEMTSFFSSSRVLVSDNCKQSITVRFLLLKFYSHCFEAW